MYLTRVKVKNFTAYKDLDLELYRGFNLIIGLSEIGKSQLLRAIRWCLENPYSYTAIRRIENGEKTESTSVTCTFDTGVSVTREQSPSVNRYVLSIPGEKDELFEKIGNNYVPDAIQRATGFSFSTPSGLINFARQRGPAFLVDDTPHDRAEILSTLSPHMMLFEEASAKAKKEAAQLQRREKELALEEEQARMKVESVGDLSVLEKMISTLSEIRAQKDDLDKKKAALLRYAQANIHMREVVRETQEKISSGEALKQSLRELEHERARLRNIASTLYSYLALSERPSNAGEITAGSKIKSSLLELQSKKHQIAEKCTALNSYLQAAAAIKAVAAQIKEAEAEREKLMKEFIVCPTCKGTGRIQRGVI